MATTLSQDRGVSSITAAPITVQRPVPEVRYVLFERWPG